MTDTKNPDQINATVIDRESHMSIVMDDMTGVSMEDFAGRESVFNLSDVNVHYGNSLAVKDVSLDILQLLGGKRCEFGHLQKSNNCFHWSFWMW